MACVCFLITNKNLYLTAEKIKLLLLATPPGVGGKLCTALAEEWHSVHRASIGEDLQPPVTPAPGPLTPSLGLLRHCTCMDLHII